MTTAGTNTAGTASRIRNAMRALPCPGVVAFVVPSGGWCPSRMFYTYAARQLGIKITLLRRARQVLVVRYE